jgi:hypothetical protein
MHETHLALATERSRIVETLAVLAQSWIVGAFVNILTDVAVPAESRVADALLKKIQKLKMISQLEKLIKLIVP